MVEANKRQRGELYKSIDADYYGYRDDDDGLLEKLEKKQQDKSASTRLAMARADEPSEERWILILRAESAAHIALVCCCVIALLLSGCRLDRRVEGDARQQEGAHGRRRGGRGGRG